jgi:hypothetical protein
MHVFCMAYLHKLLSKICALVQTELNAKEKNNYIHSVTPIA